MIAALLAFAPMLLRFIGSNALSAWVTVQKDKLQAANAAERIRLERDIALGEQELKRRELQAQLQTAEQKYLLLRLGKGLIMSVVALYWTLRFLVKIIGLDDFGVHITELATEEAVVSTMVLTYMFLSVDIKSMVGR